MPRRSLGGKSASPVARTGAARASKAMHNAPSGPPTARVRFCIRGRADAFTKARIVMFGKRRPLLAGRGFARHTPERSEGSCPSGVQQLQQPGHQEVDSEAEAADDADAHEDDGRGLAELLGLGLARHAQDAGEAAAAEAGPLALDLLLGLPGAVEEALLVAGLVLGLVGGVRLGGRLLLADLLQGLLVVAEGRGGRVGHAPPTGGSYFNSAGGWPAVATLGRPGPRGRSGPGPGPSAGPS